MQTLNPTTSSKDTTHILVKCPGKSKYKRDLIQHNHNYELSVNGKRYIACFLSRNFLDSPRPYFQVWLVCPGNHGSPGCRHSFVSGSGTIGPRKIRHKSSIIVTSIAAPKASTATRGKSHRSPSFSSILRTQVRNHCGIERWEQKKTKYEPHYSRNSIKAVHNLHRVQHLVN